MGLLDSIGSALFGESPSVDQRTLPTLTDLQRGELDSLLTALGGANTATNAATPTNIPGNLEQAPRASGAEAASLAALEERALQLATGGGAEGSIEQQVQDALASIISSGGGQVGGQEFEEFFQTNVADPLQTQFDDEFINIGRRFGGSNLFGSERSQADTDLREDFTDALVANRSNLAFQERNRAQQALLQALGLGSTVGGNITSELAQIAGAGQGARALDISGRGQILDALRAREEARVNQINATLSAIRQPAFENIVTAQGGTQGALGQLAQAAATFFA